MDTVVIVTIIFLMLALITTLVSVYIESRKHIRRLEERIERLSSRIQSMNMKELDTVLKSMKYKQERDELYKLLEDDYNRPDFGKRWGANLPSSSHLYEPSKLYTSYYTQSFSQSDIHTGNQASPSDSTSSQDSSSYSGSGGDFSGGGSGGSWG